MRLAIRLGANNSRTRTSQRARWYNRWLRQLVDLCRGDPGMTALTLDRTEATRPRAEDAKPADILVFAPHPDDESLGCAWIILQAVSAGKRVHVVLFTNGDGFPIAASAVLKKAPESLVALDYMELGRVRQQEVLTAIATLGLSPADVTFLG